jgi:cyclopropane fatty-acyl-phospholipid synthase-like methyltransferase
MVSMFKKLKEINVRPAPFEFYTAEDLWADEYTSKKMLEYHLNEAVDVSSRNKKFIERSVEWIVSKFKINGDSEIADFGCGPGLYTEKLAEYGAKVTGIDFSENSLRYAENLAEAKNLDIKYIKANYLEYDTSDSYDLITMIMCDFCALSPEQRSKMLSKFYSMLKKDGYLLLDVYSLNAFNQKNEAATYELNQLDNFWSPDDYYCFVNTFKYEKEKVILDKYTVIEESRTRTIYNWLQYFSKESLIKEFEDNGFKVAGIYSDVSGKAYDPQSPEIAIVAGK